MSALLVEHHMHSHRMKAMPTHVQSTLLAMSDVNCPDILFQLYVDAGPGTAKDRNNTLQVVGATRDPISLCTPSTTGCTRGSLRCNYCITWAACGPIHRRRSRC